MLRLRALLTLTIRPRTPALRVKLVVVFTEARAEGRQGRYKGRKAQAIQKEEKIRGKAIDKKQSYLELITSLLNQLIKPRVQNIITRFLLRC